MTGDRLTRFEHLPDQGAGWYFWKLAEPDNTARAVVWALYAVHQLISFGIIFWAQRMVHSGTESRPQPYTGKLLPINLVALSVNALFVLLHLVQTHIWYDGLAQDTHVFSSLASVAILLIWVLMIENPRRGMFFGMKAPLGRSVTTFARKYHGYYFSWAILYTFWFHPTEHTSGHLWGFFYLLLIMLQGSLFFTRMHTNRWWTLILEVMVLIHGSIVAVNQGTGLWPMFAFGFGGMFIITQMHGLSWSRSTRLAVFIAYLAGLGWVYQDRGWGKLNEVLRIPIIDYAGVLILTILFAAGLGVARRLGNGQRRPMST